MTESVARHRTAMTRAVLSRPIASAMSDGVLSTALSVFDFGCGRGDDLRNLAALGYRIDGWDPSHRPATVLHPADVVNLGFVVNVIEDRAERRETLQRAWNLAEQVLIVSARLVWEARDLEGRPHGDGLVTRTGTFQKFYEQTELAAWIEEVLGVKPIAAAPGIFYAFRDAARAHEFSRRARIRIGPVFVLIRTRCTKRIKTPWHRCLTFLACMRVHRALENSKSPLRWRFASTSQLLRALPT